MNSDTKSLTAKFWFFVNVMYRGMISVAEQAFIDAGLKWFDTLPAEPVRKSADVAVEFSTRIASNTEGDGVNYPPELSGHYWAKTIYYVALRLSSQVPALQLLVYAAGRDYISMDDAIIIHRAIRRTMPETCLKKKQRRFIHTVQMVVRRRTRFLQRCTNTQLTR